MDKELKSQGNRRAFVDFYLKMCVYFTVVVVRVLFLQALKIQR